MTSEHQRLEAVAEWHTSFEGFESKLLHYNFLSLEPHFVGTDCLELGSADGQMTGQLLDRFESVTSVEGSEKFCKDLEERYADRPSHSVVHSLFEDFSPSQRFDTVVASNVVEHLEDPVAIMRAAREWVAPTGRFIALVPNALSIHRQLGVKMGMLSSPYELSERDIALAHRRVYDLDTFRADVIEAGWNIELSGGCYLKAMSNAQSEQWLSDEMMDGYFALGGQFPDIAATIYVVCTV